MLLPNAVKQLFDLKQHEFRIVVWSSGYFFLLLTAYYTLRPMRETFGVSRSADDLPYIFLTTMLALLFVAPLIGGLVSKYQRRQFIPLAYRFVTLNLILFFIAFMMLPVSHHFYIGIVFYIWLSVINMLLISLFWGFIADGIIFSNSKKLFPMIAIGGTLGAILGGSITNVLVEIIGHTYLLLVPIIFLEVAIWVMRKIDRLFVLTPTQNISNDDDFLWHKSTKNLMQCNAEEVQKKQAKNTLSRFHQWTSGIQFALKSPYLLAISGYIFFYGLTSTFLYFQQGQLVAQETQNAVERTQIFAHIDIYANVLTLIMQLYVSQHLLKKFGLGIILIGLPIFTLAGFISLSLLPSLAMLIIFQTLRRSLNYGLFKPARETLFTLLPSEQKYKAKSFVDSFVYRGGDAIGAVSQKILTAFQLGVSSIALLIVPIALDWSALALYLGKKSQAVNDKQQAFIRSKNLNKKMNQKEKHHD